MRYNQRITLQSRTDQDWKGGVKTSSWATVATYWANVSESGKEEYTNVKGQQDSILKLIMRSQISLDKSIHRFVFSGRNVHIETINDMTNRDYNMTVFGRVYES